MVSLVCILGWSVPALLMLNRGFSVEDGGSYVLSYRYWGSNPYFVSGSQYLYGPVFESVGESIPVLRLLRLLMVIGCNALFGWAFVSWLAKQRPDGMVTSRRSLTLLLTASGGMSYLWAPLTPGYYDLTAQASLVLASVMLVALTREDLTGWWNPVAAGVVAVVLLVTKWTAAPVAMLTVGVTVLALLRRHPAAGVRYVVLVAAGIVSALGAMQLFLIPLHRFISVMTRVSSLTAHDNHGLGYLARSYASNTAEFLLAAMVVGLPLLGAYLIARRLGASNHNRGAIFCLVSAAVATTVALPVATGWHGGSNRGRIMVAVALAGLLMAGIAALTAGASPLLARRTDIAVLAVLTLVPILQAAGTNVPLLYVAGECLAMWTAVVLMLAANGPTLSSFTVLIDLCVVVVAIALLGGTTTLLDPFKTSGYASDTASVPQLGLRLASGTAEQDRALERAVDPYVDRDRTPMFTAQSYAGLIYLLRGVPVGSTWNDLGSGNRTAGILKLACDNGDVAADMVPILLLTRQPSTTLVRALGHCGFNYPRDYRQLAVPHGPPQVRVFVPSPPTA
jgi:hypothetical protein